ncbi:MAG TPA: hypothetical protein VM056_06520 [Terriglobales bacterium]|nr:hypothetical protein [Terriglobales bacterium]
MRLTRQLHLYLGLFFAPTIIFFAFTGFLQTYSLHEANQGVPPQPWIVALEQVHTHQRMPSFATPSAPTTTPANSAPAPATTPSATAPATSQASSATATTPPPRPPRRKRSTPLKIFMGFMSVGLIISSFLGVYMSFQLNRNPALIWGLLLAGALIPMAALYLGTRP